MNTVLLCFDDKISTISAGKVTRDKRFLSERK
jgi:hypothetical protein